MKYSEIKSNLDLYVCLNRTEQSMNYLIYGKRIEKAYETFEIDKKNGTKRRIASPNRHLKSVQRSLLNLLDNRLVEIIDIKKRKRNVSHAFQKDRSIITNAKIHRNKKFVLNIDLEDFFGSIHYGRVVGFFEKNNDFKVPREVAVTIARIVCYEGALPQGAPTSPIISNLICKILDLRLITLAKKYKSDYSRYADDLSFSSNSRDFYERRDELITELTSEITRAGFKINIEKTRFQNSESRQEVTGLIVNHKLSVPREYYKNTRAMAYSLYKNGKFSIDNIEGTMDQLEGRFNYINLLDKYNNQQSHLLPLKSYGTHHQSISAVYDNIKQIPYYRILNSREIAFRNFLFYKYFYANDRPIIITEGKTDSKYIKAALKKLHSEYPLLIEKNGNTFDFKVQFLNRSKLDHNHKMSRLFYFFKLTNHGGSNIYDIVKYMIPNKDTKTPNLFDYFYALSNINPRNPTIILIDNDVELVNFIGKVCSNESGIDKKFLTDTIQKEQFSALTDEYKTYLLTNNLVNNMDTCEIEDLFTDKTLSTQIDGKTLGRDKNLKPNECSKQVFSDFVERNYETIDFNGFKQLLNTMSKIIESS